MTQQSQLLGAALAADEEAVELRLDAISASAHDLRSYILGALSSPVETPTGPMTIGDALVTYAPRWLQHEMLEAIRGVVAREVAHV